jgi:hypothetical protein
MVAVFVLLLAQAPAEEPGKLGGAGGAAGGCLAGVAAPAAVFGAGYALLSYMYGQAAVGACVGVAPALVAVGTTGGMCGAVVFLPPLAAGAAVAGAMYGAQHEGRDPRAALLGGAPGIALAGVASVTMITGLIVGTLLGLGGLAPAAVIVLIGAVAGVVSIPLAATGAGITDAAYAFTRY